jgi:hypothetical protein
MSIAPCDSSVGLLGDEKGGENLAGGKSASASSDAWQMRSIALSIDRDAVVASVAEDFIDQVPAAPSVNGKHRCRSDRLRPFLF